ncbi:competence damage-inducible protein A [Citrobacter koseri]|nr:competence damage-inducible protein A [Citrobacter koseri]
MLNVEMLSTGDEVLHGQIVDTNAAWLADFFFNQGLPLSRRNTVGDNLDALVAILRERSEHADVLIVNGGLGPTSDDLSALAAATAKGEGLVLHDAWLLRWSVFSMSAGGLWRRVTASRQNCPPAPSLLITRLAPPVGLR